MAIVLLTISQRDLGKKIQTYECDFDETTDKMTKVLATFEEKEKEFKNAEEDVGALSRRVMLMEEEAKKADTSLAETSSLRSPL